MFGYRQDAIYCPQRSAAARTIQRSHTALHWILVIAEEQMKRYAPEASISVVISHSILKRRAKGYGILRKLLNNPNFDLETAVTTLRYAISAECYARNGDACKEHLKALDALMQQPGARDFFAANAGQTALTMANLKRIYVNAPVRIESSSDFEAIRTMVVLNLRRLQSISRQNHAELIRHVYRSSAGRTHEDDSNEPRKADCTSKPTSAESLLGWYFAVKKSTLFSTYACQAMNSTCDPGSKYSYQAGLFLLFYDFNMTMAALGNQNLANKINFLERLKTLMDGSAAQSLGATGLSSFVDWVREQHFSECFGKEDMALKEVDLCTYATNALKIFALLDSNARIRLTAALRAWLLTDISTEINQEKEDLKEEDFVAMEEQVTRAWWKDHLTSKHSTSPSMSPEA